MRQARSFFFILLGLVLLSPRTGRCSVSLPYTTDFTGDTLWSVQTGQGSNWELGLPAFGATTGAHSAPDAWDVELQAPVADSTVSYLYSPSFDFRSYPNCRLSFWQNRACEDYFDGFRLEYSLDGGAWNVLGLAGDPNGRNWYARNNIASSGLPAWTGDSHGWVRSEYRLTQLNTFNGTVRFRFVFTSGDSISSTGCSIDDFSIERAADHDAELRAVIRPYDFVAAGQPDSVAIIVRNVGDSVLDTVNLEFTTDGIINFTQQVTVNLAPSEEDTLVLQWQYTPPTGSFYLTCFLSDPADGDHSNDTVIRPVFGMPIWSCPVNDSFDGPISYWRTGEEVPWSLVPDEPGGISGHWDDSPSGDYAPHTDAYLYSPFVQWSGQRNVRCSFRQQCETETGYDGFRLEYTVDGGTVWSPVGSQGTENSENWYDAAAVSAFNGAPAWSGQYPDWRLSRCILSELDGWSGLVQFRFHLATDGSNNADGVRVDDFRLSPAPDTDLSINRLSASAAFARAFTRDTLWVRIRNTGNNDLLDPQVRLNAGGVQRDYTWSGLLPAGDTVEWVLDTISLPEGPAGLSVTSLVPGDGDTLGDTFTISAFGIPECSLPFSDDLEAMVRFADPSGNWQLGKPGFSSEVAAASGMNAWNIPGSGSYRPRTRAFLYSPFFDLRGWYNPRLKFRHWYNTQSVADGGRVECSLDGGTTWSTLGQRNDPLGINWYNTSSLYAGGQPGWSGSSGSWGESVYWMPGLSDYAAGPVQFRFVFESDDSVAVDGWSIDDIRLEASPSHSVSPEAIIGFPDPLAPVLPAVLQCRVRNTGALPVSELDVRVYIDDSLYHQQHLILPAPIGNGQSTTATVQPPWQPAPGGHTIRVIASAQSPADAWPADDTLELQAGILDTSRVESSVVSWCDDFDGTQPAWLSLDPLTRAWQYQWQYGTPQKPGWNGAFNGMNAWVTGLEAPYAASTACALYTPVFSADSGRCYRFSFRHLMEVEEFQDGGTVEYSLDRGRTWQVLGAAGDPGWFNTGYINGLGLPPVPGFTGTVPAWTLAAHDLVLERPTEILFRFRFGSDASVEMNGWAIDQVCFAPVTTCTIGVEEDAAGLIIEGPYPNPATGRAVLRFQHPADDYVISVTDIRGTKIVMPVIPASSHEVALLLNGLPAGIYVICIEQEGSLVYRRLVVR